MAATTSYASVISTTFHLYPLGWLATAWCLGTLLAKQWLLKSHTVDVDWLAIQLISATAVILVVGYATRKIKWLNAPLVLLGVVLATAAYACARAPSHQDDLSADFAQRQAQSIRLRGVITSAASWKPTDNLFQGSMQEPTGDQAEADQNDQWSTRWEVQWTEVRHGKVWQPVRSFSDLLVSGRIDDFLPGDIVEVVGKARKIIPPPNPGMSDYAEAARYAGKFISVSAKRPTQIQRVGMSARYWPNRLRAIVVRWVDETLRDRVGGEQSPLAAALVFGQQEQVDWEVRQTWMATGTIHILAISGLHVDVVAYLILAACLMLPIRPRRMFVLTITSLFLYACLAGGAPPVLRALIQASAVATARYFGLVRRLPNLLGLAVVVLLLLNPAHLFNVGVQLSFLSVATLGVFVFKKQDVELKDDALEELILARSNVWRRTFSWLQRYLWLAGRTGFWVWLLNVPIVWNTFHVISPVAIPLNILASPIIFVAMVTGLFTGLLGWIPILGDVGGAITWVCLCLVTWIIDVGYAIPWSHVWLPSPPTWWIATFYVFTAIWMVVFRNRLRTWLGAGLVGWTLFGWLLYVPGPTGLLGRPTKVDTDGKQKQLQCTFLDVGHGTSVIIQLHDGRVWLYDAGHLGDSVRSFQFVAPTLWEIGCTRIDTLIISHADTDHYNAVMGLVERFKIGRVASTQRFWKSDEPSIVQLRDSLDRKGIERLTWNSETTLDLGSEVQAEVLHPSPGFRAETDNADSLVLQLEYAGVRTLLTGDIEGSGLLMLCEQSSRKCNVMMAPHHGSLSMDPTDLLGWCQPEVVVVSCGPRTPCDTLLKPYENVKTKHVTFCDFAFQVRIDPDGSTENYRWKVDHWELVSLIER